MNLKLSQFDFDLPKNLIAQKPASPRDACRLMILDRKNKTIQHDQFYNLDQYLKRGDVLVLNDSKVLPARLLGKKETGGKAEILLLKQLTGNAWECLVGFVPIKKQLDFKINFRENLKGKIIQRNLDTALIKFNLSGGKLMKKILKIGQAPTPPYIKRMAKREEYQTIYAKKLGSIAAPTAGLHFTKKVFQKLKNKGVQIKYITLHVGLGTFQPVKTEDIKKHPMHSEYFHLNNKTCKHLNIAKKQGRRIIAVGTTVVRTLEHSIKKIHNSYFIIPSSNYTSIFIYPGYKFKFVDAMITNFHVPKSTLIMLVSAFAGKKFIDKAYQTAIKKKYRFYSFGDCMLIE
jgi:S-adenosylmethionine:tRNA ribosyltransferase-isomerase